MADRAVYHAILGAEAVAASTAYVLVDLSDTDNYPHRAQDGTAEVHLLGLNLSAETHTVGIFDIWVGVISEVDATNGTAEWVHVFHIENDTEATDDTGHFAESIDFTLGGYVPEGMNCSITAAGALAKLVTNLQQAGHTNWQTDTGLASPVGAAAGATGRPGAGDLVVWVEEVTNGGTIDFCLGAAYSTA